METIGCIYIITCLINNKIYIGQTTRKGRALEIYLGGGVLISSAIKKYGKENFTKRILCICNSQKALDVMEEFYIKKYDSTNKEIGYNILPGTSYCFGSGSPINIKEVKEKISGMNHHWNKNPKNKEKISGKNHHNYGKIMPEEQRKKISYSLSGDKSINYGKFGENSNRYGKKHTQESKDKMSLNSKGEKNPMYGKKGEEHPCFGIAMTYENRKKNSERMKGNKLTLGRELSLEERRNISERNKLRVKPIEIYNPETGETERKFNSIKQAKEEIGGNITLCLKGQQKQANGFSWRYSEI